MQKDLIDPEVQAQIPVVELTPAEKRYQIIPQMRIYDNLRQQFVPYISQANPLGYQSGVLNTNRLGFRDSYWFDQRINSDNWFNYPRKGLLLGGSVAMGWGSTCDNTQLASCLAREIGKPIQCLGVMAANSTQEFIAGLPFYQHTDFTITCTGINTLYTCLFNGNTDYDLYSPLYELNNLLYHKIRDYDLLTMNYLVNDDLDPEDYFKSESQRDFFRKFISKRFIRRIIRRIIQRFQFRDVNLPKKSLEAGLEMAVDIQCRDLLNMKNVCAGKPFLVVIQPLFSVLDKLKSEEEKNIYALSRLITCSDSFNSLEGLEKYWLIFVARVRSFCEEHHINYLDLNTKHFEGWCFIDTSYLTDRGNQQTARYIASAVQSIIEGMNKNVQTADQKVV